METNLNFLYALLIVIVIASVSLAVRTCAAPKFPPAFTRHTTIESAVAASAESGRPVLALFTADWCGECQKFKRSALSSSRVTSWIQDHVETAYIDVSGAAGGNIDQRRLLTRHRVQAVPVLIMLEPGQELTERARIEGNIRRRDLLAWLEKHGGR